MHLTCQSSEIIILHALFGCFFFGGGGGGFSLWTNIPTLFRLHFISSLDNTILDLLKFKSNTLPLDFFFH